MKKNVKLSLICSMMCIAVSFGTQNVSATEDVFFDDGSGVINSEEIDNGNFIEGQAISNVDKNNILDDGVIDDSTSSLAGNEFSEGEDFLDSGRASANLFGYFFYEIDRTGNINITKYAGREANVIVPEMINGKKVTSIAKSAFYNNSYITSVMLPGSVKYIGEESFRECDNLKKVSMSGVTEIGKAAFMECTNLDDIDLSKVEKISVEAFYKSGIKEVNLASLKGIIGYDTFYNCPNLNTVTIPFATTIGSRAFGECSNLITVNLPEVTVIGKNAFQLCENLTEVQMPKLNKVEESAFETCKSLREIELNQIREIGVGAFYNCVNLQTVKFGNRINAIDRNAFYNCISLKSVNLPDDILTSLDDCGLGWKSCSDRPSFEEKMEDFTIHCGEGTEGNIYAVKNYFLFNFHEYEEKLIKPASEEETGKVGQVCKICNQIKKGGETIHCLAEYKLSSEHFKYNGLVQRPEVTVLDVFGHVVSPEYYDVIYSGDGIAIGKYIVTLTFKGKYTGTKELAYYIDDNKAKITVSDLNIVVGKSKKLKVKVSGEYNGLSYKSANPKIVSITSEGKITAKKVGETTITIIAGATERYDSVTKDIKVKVVPSKTTILSVLKSGKGKLKLTWKAVSGVDGYVIYRSTNLYDHGKKIKTIRGNNTLNYTNASLKNGKKYYYSIRAFKEVNGKRYYSDYSNIKGATTFQNKIIKKFGGIYNLDANGYGIAIEIVMNSHDPYDIIPYEGICARFDVSIRIGSGGVSHSIGSLLKKGGNKYYISSSEFDGGIVTVSSNSIMISGTDGGNGKYRLTERY